MTRVSMRIARGYLAEVVGVREQNPTLDEVAAIKKWVKHRYGTWITDNITRDFTIHDVTDQGFQLEFEQLEHARAFVRVVGGVIR